MKRLFDWMFRNRRTGAVTIVQFPNLPLWLFIAGSLVLRLADLHGTTRAIVVVVTTASLAIWAFLEVVLGVNPWRRILGAVVLAGTVYGVVR